MVNVNYVVKKNECEKVTVKVNTRGLRGDTFVVRRGFDTRFDPSINELYASAAMVIKRSHGTKVVGPDLETVYNTFDWGQYPDLDKSYQMGDNLFVKISLPSINECDEFYIELDRKLWDSMLPRC